VATVQATVHRFDAATGNGSVVTDEGLIVPFSGEVLAASGLRHVRVGQRLSIDVDDPAAARNVVGMRLGTVGATPGSADGAQPRS
jgi:hypothetical protein